MIYNFHVFLMTRLGIHPYAIYAITAALTLEWAIWNENIFIGYMNYSSNSLAGAGLITIGTLLAYTNLTGISGAFESQLFARIAHVRKTDQKDIDQFKIKIKNEKYIDLSIKRTLIALIIFGTIQNGLG